jgi:hypothetical protein
MFTEDAKWAAYGRAMAASPLVKEQIWSSENQLTSIFGRNAEIFIRAKALCCEFDV